MEYQDIDTKLRQQHEQIKTEIKAISASLSTDVSEEEFPSWRLDLLWALRDCLNDLQKHFDLEEEGGFLSNVLKIAPQHQQAVKRLAEEHGTVSLRLNEAISAIKTLSLADRQNLRPIWEEVESIFRLLREHEAVEGELLLTTYSQDEGAG
jgi:hemerythrin-like domain-containing protein